MNTITKEQYKVLKQLCNKYEYEQRQYKKLENMSFDELMEVVDDLTDGVEPFDYEDKELSKINFFMLKKFVKSIGDKK